jgi:glutamine---fructose-6-phosphate transaminase (isomerizing)
MSATDFLTDLEAKPAALERLAAALEAGNPFENVPRDVDRVLFLGMGSSRYAALDAALDLRAAGIAAAAEYASAKASFPPDPRTLVVAVSASGESAETLAAIERYRGRSPILAITNAPNSSLAGIADVAGELLAGEEHSGVACRTFLHTALLLRALGAHLTGVAEDVAGLTRRVAAATAELLRTRDRWLPAVADALDTTNPVCLIAPAGAMGTAEQGALMIREGPRRPAIAAETGDWSHVEVYLTKTLDYRALFLAGSRWDEQALEWLRKRHATFVALGGRPGGARLTIEFAGSDDPDVVRYAAILVPELIAAHWWTAER